MKGPKLAKFLVAKGNGFHSNGAETEKFASFDPFLNGSSIEMGCRRAYFQWFLLSIPLTRSL